MRDEDVAYLEAEIETARLQISDLEDKVKALEARVAELESARRLCEECLDDDEELDLGLVGDWHCGSCGAAI